MFSDAQPVETHRRFAARIEPCGAANIRGAYSTHRRDLFRRIFLHELLKFTPARHPLRDRPFVAQLLLDHRARQRIQQCNVCSWPDWQVDVGVMREFNLPWINNNELYSPKGSLLDSR